MSRLQVAAALLAVFALAAFVAPFASDEPDGLQSVARKEGFAATETGHALKDGPLAGYSVEGVEDEEAGTGMSGLVGSLLAFTLAGAAFRALARRRGRTEVPS